MNEMSGALGKTRDITGKGLKIVKENIDFMDSIPIVRELPDIVKQQILVGGVTGAATYVYEKFLAEEPPQEEGETYEEYMARRKENVGGKMRTYFDNYFKFDKDYSGMTDEQKDAFVARYNLARGGRVGYQTGGITMANTLQQNIAANRAQAAGIQALLNQARASAGLPTVQVPAQTTTAAPTQTTTAAPAPSITKSTSAPAQAAPTAQQIASAMLSSNPMASSGTSILPSLPSKVAVVQPTSSSQSTGMGGLLPQLTQQVASQIASAPPIYSGPIIDDSTTQAEFDKLSDRDQLLALQVFGGSGRFGYGKEGVDPMDKNTPGS
jgi:hypothetical protein